MINLGKMNACPFCAGVQLAIRTIPGGLGQPDATLIRCKECGAMGPPIPSTVAKRSHVIRLAAVHWNERKK